MKHLTDFLIKTYSEYQRINTQLLTEISENVSSIDAKSIKKNLFLLHRIAGRRNVPSRKEIFCFLKDINKIKEFNPFIINEKNIFYDKIECYLVQETLIQQIQRAILLISKYNLLDSENDKDEKERMLENILNNVIMERVYNVKEYPSWLLFEFENNLLIRKNQYFLTQAMMQGESNSIYQLNMGEGKTSVILILLSEMLADGKQVVRINCLESLMGVMQDLLKIKFRGLLQKKIYIMPFSRGVVLSEENIIKIKEMIAECQKEKHILLVTPEQRLCFQLKKQEMFLEYSRSSVANDYFDYNEILNQKYANKIVGKVSYNLRHYQEKLIRVLQNLSYIDIRNRILKFPSEGQEGLSEFYQELHDQLPDFDLNTIKIVYNILRDQSNNIKNERRHKIEQLYSVDEYKFFDILDESDEILRHGKELNYTLGSSHPFDGGETRWEIPFLLFKMIFFEKEIYDNLNDDSQTEDCPVIFQENFRPASGIGGGIPYVRFVKKEYFIENIKPKLRRMICETIRSRFCLRTSNIIDEQNENYGNYEDFIEGKCSTNERKIIAFLKIKNQILLNNLLVAKAWLSHELLYHVMSYRHRVEYGLSEKRLTDVAVPFRGKDLPSEKSDFSHADVMIGFTILSYLYRGLDIKQVFGGLMKLKIDVKQDRDSLLAQWVQENESWINEYIQLEKDEFPHWLKSFKTLDLQNKRILNKVHMYLSRNFSFIQYYLSNFTFPKNTKHYTMKLTGDAHTLAGEGKTKGFSGTDDRNDTMPESVNPRRLPSQESTNGKMLHILSRRINSKYECNIDLSSSINILNRVCKYVEENKACCILIDAGATITEMNNFHVGKHLIRYIDQNFEGVVYFSDETNQIMVILRNNDVLPLATCHIDNKKLFVYLDEVHTRGTDLKLPLTARGIVTLGKNLNKDKLMQAIMRLRDLDFKQSIVIWGSREISATIANVNGIKPSDITSRHVLIWATYNTIKGNEHDLYPVMHQKLKYVIKSRALEYQQKVKDTPIDALTQAYVTESLNSIEKSYGITPQKIDPRDLLRKIMNYYLNDYYPRLKYEINSKTRRLPFLVEIDSYRDNIDKSKMEEMLKRVDSKLPKTVLNIIDDYKRDQETEQEIEEIQQIEYLPIMKQTPSLENPWDFNVVFDPNFIDKGFSQCKGFPKLKLLKDCFEFIDIKDLKELKWPKQILTTENFIKTIKDLDEKKGQYQTNYLRPVNMILIYQTDQDRYFIVVSAFEAHNLVKLCRERDNCTVSLMHVDDVNGPTMILSNGPALPNDEITNTLAVIRLFNGESRYSTEEISAVKRCIAFVERGCLHENIRISEQIYDELDFKGYVANGFMTNLLLTRLKDESEKLLITIDNNFMIHTSDRLRSIIDKSIANDLHTISRLPAIIIQLIKARGKSEKYQNSELKKILNENVQSI